MPQGLIGRLSSLMSTIMVISMLAIPIAAASEEIEQTMPFMAGAFECPYDPGMVSYANGSVPADCLPIAGMFMQVSVNDTSVESCVTGGDGLCFVSVPVDSWLVITQDGSARPDLMPVSNPLSRHSTAMDAIFVHVVAPVVVPEPEAVLPDPVVPEPVVPDPVVPDPEAPDPVVPEPVVPELVCVKNVRHQMVGR